MNENTWGFVLKNYWLNGLETAWTIYIPLLMVAVFVLLSMAIHTIRAKITRPSILRAWTSIYLSGIITIILGELITLCLLQFSSFFASHFYQMGFILGIVLLSSIVIFVFAKICTIVKNKSENALGMVITTTEQSNAYTRCKKYCLSLWIISLLLATPFITLLIHNNNKYLISIVLDNSGSMDDHLAQCTMALETALLPTRQSADYVLTTIDPNKKSVLLDQAANKAADIIVSSQASLDRGIKQLIDLYYNDLINEKATNRFQTTTVVYNDALSMFNDFSQISCSVDGSPIYEAIWQNYIESNNLAKQNSYIDKKMIVITDGADNLYLILEEVRDKKMLIRKDIFKQEDQTGQTADNFYNSICAINYGDSRKLLFEDCAKSIDNIYDGTDEQSYFDAFRDILPEMFFDYFLLCVLILLSVVLSGTLFIIKLSKL